MKTLVVIRYLQVGDRHFRHGEELPPDLLPRKGIDLHLDRKELVEYDSAERRSLHALFNHFSGCSKKERLSNQEKATYALTE
jgi:hypothetical protein